MQMIYLCVSYDADGDHVEGVYTSEDAARHHIWNTRYRGDIEIYRVLKDGLTQWTGSWTGDGVLPVVKTEVGSGVAH